MRLKLELEESCENLHKSKDPRFWAWLSTGVNEELQERVSSLVLALVDLYRVRTSLCSDHTWDSHPEHGYGESDETDA